MNKKTTIAVALIALAVCTVGLAFLRSGSANQEAQDKANLQKQTSGAGTPAGMFDPKQMQARMLDDMSQQLGLSPSQSEKLGKIQEAGFPAMRTVMDDASLTEQQKRERMQKAREDQEKQIHDLLTPEQQSKYDTMQTQMRERMAQNRGGMPGGGPGMPPDGMAGGPGMPPGGGPGMPPGGQFAGGMPGPPPGGMPNGRAGAPNGAAPGSGN